MQEINKIFIEDRIKETIETLYNIEKIIGSNNNVSTFENFKMLMAS